MARIELTGGAYATKGVAAAAQRCLNLYPEAIPQQQGEPAQFLHVQTPGLTPAGQGIGPVRGMYTAGNGQAYVVCGGQVYTMDADGALANIGGIVAGNEPVRMQDNGLVLVIVDGSSRGWFVTLGQAGVTAIADEAFYGSATVAALDTRLAFVRPDTAQFYLSPSEYAGTTTSFDSLYIAAKVTYPDNLVAVAAVGQNLWLLGRQTTELWYDTGASDFPDERVAGVLISHGCAAPYSVATADSAVYWVASDLQGQGIVMRGQGYEAQRISTHALEAQIGRYPDLSEAIAYTYQQGGHLFYVLNFPRSDRTWVYDAATGLWHERCWIDAQGVEHRIRGGACCAAYGKVFVGDHDTGQIYILDTTALTDAGQPIKRLRSFPHLVQDFRRVTYHRFVADMQAGTATGSDCPTASLRWSNDRGATWTAPVTLSLGTAGATNTRVQLPRLGVARDRVFELSWTSAVDTVLLGAWIDAETHGS